jgi:protein TonB
LNRRPGTLPPVPHPAAATAPAKPELIGYDQTPHSQTPPASPVEEPPNAVESTPGQDGAQAKKADEKVEEQQLFAYITGGQEESEEKARPHFRLGKKVVLGALVLAGCAIAFAPQAPWHPQVRALWSRGRQAIHAWFNPQPVTTPLAPPSHEDFGRPGDEYKLPVAENIPDATTDPSQIRVVPVVDPTAKKPNNTEPGQTAGQTEGTGSNPGDQAQAPATQGQGGPPAQPATVSASATNEAPTAASTPGSAAAAAAAERLRSDTLAGASTPASSVAPGLAQPRPPVNPLPHSVSTPTPTAGIPSSLKSDMASMTPDASGNKPVEAALPSIEPVDIPEATARGLLTEQPALAYPASAKGQQGTVVLQVLIGRDGTVQDAKFLQGSLAFARTAIDGAKQWKFKPYMLNGRAVSVQTKLTLDFKPAS